MIICPHYATLSLFRLFRPRLNLPITRRYTNPLDLNLFQLVLKSNGVGLASLSESELETLPERICGALNMHLSSSSPYP